METPWNSLGIKLPEKCKGQADICLHGWNGQEYQCRNRYRTSLYEEATGPVAGILTDLQYHLPCVYVNHAYKSVHPSYLKKLTLYNIYSTYIIYMYIIFGCIRKTKHGYKKVMAFDKVWDGPPTGNVYFWSLHLQRHRAKAPMPRADPPRSRTLDDGREGVTRRGALHSRLGLCRRESLRAVLFI